ncbi:polycomb complex protein BMI-1-B-like, partial [Physella acuta]|uniref:polycomb complex protein BMI-1-B-like n=1 Tax=Physella acuta TaxID=109671 RepID=UPI0027DAE4BC
MDLYEVSSYMYNVTSFFKTINYEGKTEPSSAKRLRISELNPHLLCALCGGYLIDATTIIECLHSFCKTCILRYLETSNYCPICEVLIHKTRPWQNIRLDHSLQNAVYKMVPGLFQNEMKRRREFYEKHKQEGKLCFSFHSFFILIKIIIGRRDNREKFIDVSIDHYKRGRLLPEGEVGDRIIFSQDEEFSISIEFSPDGKPVADTKTTSLKRQKTNCQHDKRYLKCPAALRIEHLKKFIRSKFSLPASIQIDLFLEKEPLCDSFTLMDVAYIYMWKRDCVLRLFYSFFEIPAKIRKVETVTLNSEKVSKKNKVTDKKDGTEDKQKEDRKTKNRKEKPRERKQTNITGKGEVTANQSTASQQPANHVASCEKNQIILSSHNSSCEKNNPVIPSHDVGCDKNQPISASHTTGNEKNNSVIASHNNGLEKNQPIRASHDSSCNKTQPVVTSHDEGSTRNQPDLLMNCSNAHLKRKHSDTGQSKKSPSVVKQGKVPPQTNILKQGKVPPQTNIQKQGKGPQQNSM